MQTKTISRQFKTLYKDLHAYLELVHTNNRLQPEHQQFLVSAISRRLNCDDLPVRQSLAHLDLDQEGSIRNKYRLLLDTLWRMLANKDALVHGTAVLPYRKFTIPEQVEVFFSSVFPDFDRDGKRHVVFKVLTGHYAMEPLPFNLTEGSIFHILRNIGYSGSNKYPMPAYPEELRGLFGKLDIDVDNGTTRIKDVVKDDTIVQYNRENSISYRLGNKLCPEEVGRMCMNCEHSFGTCRASMQSSEFMWNVHSDEVEDLNFIMP